MRPGSWTALVMMVALLVPWMFGQELNVSDDSEDLRSLRGVTSLDGRAFTMAATMPQPVTATHRTEPISRDNP